MVVLSSLGTQYGLLHYKILAFITIVELRKYYDNVDVKCYLTPAVQDLSYWVTYAHTSYG